MQITFYSGALDLADVTAISRDLIAKWIPSASTAVTAAVTAAAIGADTQGNTASATAAGIIAAIVVGSTLGKYLEGNINKTSSGYHCIARLVLHLLAKACWGC